MNQIKEKLMQLSMDNAPNQSRTDWKPIQIEPI